VVCASRGARRSTAAWRNSGNSGCAALSALPLRLPASLSALHTDRTLPTAPLGRAAESVPITRSELVACVPSARSLTPLLAFRASLTGERTRQLLVVWNSVPSQRDSEREESREWRQFLTRPRAGERRANHDQRHAEERLPRDSVTNDTKVLSENGAHGYLGEWAGLAASGATLMLRFSARSRGLLRLQESVRASTRSSEQTLSDSVTCSSKADR